MILLFEKGLMFWFLFVFLITIIKWPLENIQVHTIALEL